MDATHDALVGPGTKLTSVGPVCFTDVDNKPRHQPVFKTRKRQSSRGQATMGADETRTECPSLFEGFFRRHTASKWSSRRRMKTEQRSCVEVKISIDVYIYKLLRTLKSLRGLDAANL